MARWQLLFASSREFFYAPMIEEGPLPRWKAIAGRGEKMFSVFLTLKRKHRPLLRRPLLRRQRGGRLRVGHKPAGAA